MLTSYVDGWYKKLCVPMFALDGLDLVANLTLISGDLKLGGCLNANIGGSGNTFLRVGSCIIVFQWVFIIVIHILLLLHRCHLASKHKFILYNLIEKAVLAWW